MRKKLAQIYVQFFGNFAKLHRLSYHGSNSGQGQIGGKGIKRHFSGTKWINNILKSDSVRYNIHLLLNLLLA